MRGWFYIGGYSSAGLLIGSIFYRSVSCFPVRILIFNFQSPALGVFANHTHLIADRKLPVFLGLPDVNGDALGWQFCFPVFIQNKLVAADDEIKIAACLFPDFEKQRAWNTSFGAQK
jgi:hypothetical protein